MIFADIALSKDAGGNDSLVEYSDVSFGYTGKNVLNHISFTMKKGEMTALVGPIRWWKIYNSLSSCEILGYQGWND